MNTISYKRSAVAACMIVAVVTLYRSEICQMLTPDSGSVNMQIDAAPYVEEPQQTSSNRKLQCFPRATGTKPPQKGQVTGGTTFGQALTQLAKQPDIHRILEIGTWYGGGSTQSFVEGLKNKAHCRTNATHHCCESFIVTFEIYEPAWEYARLYHQDNPVWLVKGTTVGEDLMLKDADIPQSERGEHYRLYYERDMKIMKSSEPQLQSFCDRLTPDVVLIDGNEYTGWGEFTVVMEHCRPRYLALHDTGTLKTKKVEAFIEQKQNKFSLHAKGEDKASWTIYRVLDNQL